MPIQPDDWHACFSGTALIFALHPSDLQSAHVLLWGARSVGASWEMMEQTARAYMDGRNAAPVHIDEQLRRIRDLWIETKQRDALDSPP